MVIGNHDVMLFTVYWRQFPDRPHMRIFSNAADVFKSRHRSSQLTRLKINSHSGDINILRRAILSSLVIKFLISRQCGVPITGQMRECFSTYALNMYICSTKYYCEIAPRSSDLLRIAELSLEVWIPGGGEEGDKAPSATPRNLSKLTWRFLSKFQIDVRDMGF